MKKWIAFFVAAAMIMPVTAYGSEDTDEEEQTIDEEEEEQRGGALRSALGDIFGETVDEITSAYEEFKEDLGTAVEEFGYSVSDAVGGVITEDHSEYLNNGEDGEQSCELIIQSIQEDFQDTIEQLKDNLNDVYNKVGETYDAYVNNKGYIFDWFKDCQKDAERLFDRTYDSSLEYYECVASSVDRDYDSLDAALDDFYDSILDEALDGFYDEILDETFDDIYGRYYSGIIEEGYDQVDFSEFYDESSDFYEEWFNAFSEIYSDWFNTFSYLYSDWVDISSAFLWSDDFDVEAILAPAGEDILTADNCSEFADLLACEDNAGQICADFYDEHQGEVVAFDGNIVRVEPDGRPRWDGTIVYDDGYYDILICPGDYEENQAAGPQFLFDGTTAAHLGSTDTGDETNGDLPELIAEGNPVHIVAKLDKYDDEEGICYLKPVSILERGAGESNYSGDAAATEPSENENAEAEETAKADSNGTDDSGIDPDFKEALDSYEAFIDSYISFMQKYADADYSTSMLSDYLDYMQQYADMMEKMDALGDSDMNAAEAAYYMEVTLRCSRKLLESLGE